MNFENTIDEAIALRKEEKFEDSNSLLLILLNESGWAAQAHFHLAWNFDVQGLEAEALPHYKEALKGPLSPEDRQGVLLGYGSTLRCLGQYTDALKIFELASHEFPESLAFQPFHSMCLYNLGRSKEAVSMLLKLLLKTTRSDSILTYHEAIFLYAQDLDAVD